MSSTTADPAAQIHQLRSEAIAAVEQRDLLRTDARRAIITAVNDRLICRAGANDALSAWEMEPLPGMWMVYGNGRRSYTRRHESEHDARVTAWKAVTDQLWPVFGAPIWVRTVRVTDLALIDGEDDQSDSHRFRITADVFVSIRIKATTDSGAVEAAHALLVAHRQPLADQDIELVPLGDWDAEDDLADVPLDPDTEEPRTFRTTRLPDHGDDVAAATLVRDQAAAQLAKLGRAIRARAITALNTGELGIEYGDAVDRVETFFAGLGLARLPIAHHTVVTAELKLQVQAETGIQARQIVSEHLHPTMLATGEGPRWTATGWASDTTYLGDGLWAVSWRHSYDVSLRGRESAAAAADAAHALVREQLAALPLTHMQPVTLTVDRHDEQLRTDCFLDPDTD